LLFVYKWYIYNGALILLSILQECPYMYTVEPLTFKTHIHLVKSSEFKVFRGFTVVTLCTFPVC